MLSNMSGPRSNSRVMLNRSAIIVLTLSLMSNPQKGLAFLRPPACSFAPPRHGSKSKATVMMQENSARGSTPDGNVDGGAKPLGPLGADEKKVPSTISSYLETKSDPSKIAPVSVEKGKKLAYSANGGSTAAVTDPTAAADMKTTPPRSEAISNRKGVGAPKEVSKGAPGEGEVVEGTGSAVDTTKTVELPGVQAGQKVSTFGGEEAVAIERPPKRKGKGGVAAAPETTAAEKVLSLLDLGLLDKEEVAAYYDALSNFERTKQEAKGSKLAGSQNPPSSSNNLWPTRESLLGKEASSLIPFPALCAALGAAGAHSLHLVGHLDTAASAFGAVVGAGLGSLVVVGDDPVGRAARTFGSSVSRSASTAGAVAGKQISESAAEAAGAAVAAAEEAVITAPTNAAADVAKSLSGKASAVAVSVVSLPGKLAKGTVESVKGVLQDTSEVVVSLPGDVARKAAGVAGGALQSSSEAAMTAVKDSPKGAARLLNEAISSRSETLTSFVGRVSGTGASRKETEAKKRPKASQVSTSNSDQRPPITAPREQQKEDGREGIPAEELEAKMSSVQEALERFDTVKNRIESANTSGTFLETVGLSRKVNTTTKRTQGAVKLSADVKARDRQADTAKGAPSRSQQKIKDTSTSTAAVPERKPIDKKRRKEVAEELLEKASQRSTEAKIGLKAAAASARRNTEATDVATPPKPGAKAEHPDPQSVGSAQPS